MHDTKTMTWLGFAHGDCGLRSCCPAGLLSSARRMPWFEQPAVFPCFQAGEPQRAPRLVEPTRFDRTREAAKRPKNCRASPFDSTPGVTRGNKFISRCQVRRVRNERINNLASFQVKCSMKLLNYKVVKPYRSVHRSHRNLELVEQ